MTLDGNVRIKCSSLLCVIFYLPLQIPLVASLHILTYLEENSESFLCENWVLRESVLESANGGTQFSVNYYFFGQISVNCYFFGQFSVNY